MAEDQYKKITERLDRIERRLQGQKDVWSVEELAEYTGWSKSHIYRLTSRHQIPHYKPKGGNIFFRRSEIEQWLTGRGGLSGEEVRP